MKHTYFAILLLLFCCCTMAQTKPVVRKTSFRKDTVSIISFGAKSDGITLNTTAINNAINGISKRGGGVVVVPAGLWLTGPFELKSNINLHLLRNAVLSFTTDLNQYKLVESNWEGLPQMRNQSPISATNASNIAITGHGIIDGGGDAWRMVKKDKLTESNWKKLVASGGVLSDDKKTWYPSESSLKGSRLKNPGQLSAEKNTAFYEEVKDFLRPNLLVFTKCSRILLEGVTFQNSPAWCLHPLMSSDIIIRNISVKNPWYAQNGDGLDLESCSNVIVENSVFDVGDDGICIKSGRDAEGRKRAMPTQNVIIRNCTVYAAHGGFVVGSEMSGGARNIWVDDCTFIGTDIGLRFKTTRGRGGVVENIFIRNIAMKDIVGEAILFDMYYAAQDPIALTGEKREPPKVEEKPVTEETPQFRNIYIKGVVADGAQKAIFVRGLPEMNVKGIVMEDMVLQSTEGLDMTEGSDITLKNVQLIASKTDPVLNIHNSREISLTNLKYPNAQLLLFVTGEKSNNITLSNTDVTRSQKAVELGYGAPNSAVKIVQSSTGRAGAVTAAAVTNTPRSYALELATTAMTIWKDSFMLPGDKAPKWRYDQGVILKGIEGIWRATGDKKWFEYIRQSMDYYVQDDGSIKGYRPDEYNIDHINNGKLLLVLFEVTGKEKYKKAATLLREQLRTHPRTSEGGFWHKKIYPSQMWLDGLYMGQPFYAEYAKIFKEDTAFNDITRQFVLMEKHARDPKTGLLYHGWDESREQRWANRSTGLSPHIWGRALGWFGMAMVDALDHFPASHSGRDSIIRILNRFASAVTAVQDPATGLWFDIPDMRAEPKNYAEASASSMLVYTLAKAVRKGYIGQNYLANAKRGYDGILKQFIREENGLVNLHGTVAVSGLGGNPYRDGSFAYYMSEPVIVNDPKGMGAFINAANEMEMLTTLNHGKGSIVLLDNYFNNEWKKDAAGNQQRWHYIWEERSNGGFSMLGDIFNRHGAVLKTLANAPDATSLDKASVYVVVDPDNEKETERPNQITEAHATIIANWVRNGGVLLLFANDSANTNLDGINRLSSRFGIVFNPENMNMVKNDVFEQGLVEVPAGNTVFKTARKLFVKELSTITTTGAAKPLITKQGKTIVAVASVGKGTVFAIGDPWLYNEYIDGRKLPAEFDNYKAAEDLVRWALQQAKKK